jgi:hypothetical protein
MNIGRLGCTATMKPSTTLTNAVQVIFTALEPLTAKDRSKVVNAAFVLLPDDAKPIPAKPTYHLATGIPATPTGSGRFTAPAVTQADTVQKRTANAHISNMLGSGPGAVVTRDALVESWPGGAAAIDSALGRMLKAGEIIRKGQGKYVASKTVPVKVKPTLAPKTDHPGANGHDRSGAQLVRDYINARKGMTITRADLVKASGAAESDVDVEVGRLIAAGYMTRVARGQYFVVKLFGKDKFGSAKGAVA